LATGGEGEFIRRRRDLAKLAAKRMEKIKVFAAKGAWREVGINGTNLIYFVLGEISGSGGAGKNSTRFWINLPRACVVNWRSSATDFNKLELLSFAPENLVGDLKEKTKLKGLVQHLENTVDTALKLLDQSTEALDKKEV
jgi:hypothetical protein